MLPRYHARLEARCYGNMEEVRFLWDDVMTRHGREAQYWLEYAKLERYCGDVEACRKILQRAVNSASDDPEGVCQALLEFEREVGSLESYEGAMERCAAQLRRVKERREKAAEKEVQLKEEEKQRKKSEKVERKTTDHGGKQQQGRDGGRRDGGRGGGERGGKRGSGGRGEEGRGGGGEGKGRKRAKRASDEEEENETPAKKQRVGDNTSEDTKTMVAMETQPVVEQVKTKCGELSDIRLIKTKGGKSSLGGPKPDQTTAVVWLTQAKADLEALQLLQDQTDCYPELCAHVCFLAHQVAEKALKAGMYAVRGLHTKSLLNHNLDGHADVLEQERPALTKGLRVCASSLEEHYLDSRYPNRHCPPEAPSGVYTQDQARDAKQKAQRIFDMMKEVIRTEMSLVNTKPNIVLKKA